MYSPTRKLTASKPISIYSLEYFISVCHHDLLNEVTSLTKQMFNQSFIVIRTKLMSILPFDFLLCLVYYEIQTVLLPCLFHLSHHSKYQLWILSISYISATRIPAIERILLFLELVSNISLVLVWFLDFSGSIQGPVKPFVFFDSYQGHGMIICEFVCGKEAPGQFKIVSKPPHRLSRGSF